MVLVAAAAILEMNEKKSYGYVMLKADNVVSLSTNNVSQHCCCRYPMVLQRGGGFLDPCHSFFVNEIASNNRFLSKEELGRRRRAKDFGCRLSFVVCLMSSHPCRLSRSSFSPSKRKRGSPQPPAVQSNRLTVHYTYESVRH